MTFGEKIKLSRTKLKLTQEELANKVGVSRTVIISYEKDKSRPRGYDAYRKIAVALEVDAGFLINDSDEFVATANQKYGYNGKKQAENLVEEMGGLFAGGELSEDDMDGVMRAMQELYWLAKDKNKKYTPKKHLKNTEE